MRLQVPRRTLLVYSIVAPLLLTSLATGIAKGSYANGVHASASGALVQPTGTFAARSMHSPKITFAARVVRLKHGGTGSGSANVLICLPSGCEADSTTKLSETTCGSGKHTIATIDSSLSEYGIYQVKSGAVNGKCEFTVQDYYFGGSATERVVNRSN